MSRNPAIRPTPLLATTASSLHDRRRPAPPRPVAEGALRWLRALPGSPASPTLLLRIALVLAVLPLAALPAGADEMALRSAEGQRYRAMVQGDVETLERFLDDRLVYTHSHGGVDDKPSFLESLRSGEVVYRTIQLGSSDVEVWGDAAVVTGLAVLEVEAREQRITAPVRFTAVYRRGPDLHWRLLAWQTTPSGDVETRPLAQEEPAAPTPPPPDSEPPPRDGEGGTTSPGDGSRR